MVLGWLSLRSLPKKQMAQERQQSLLYQGVADGFAKEADDFMAGEQQQFGQAVENLLASSPVADNANATFDKRLRAAWPDAEVGFVVTVSGQLLCPAPFDGPLAQNFYAENGKFVCNIKSEEVYLNNSKLAQNNFNVGAQNNILDLSPLKNNNNAAQQQQLRNVAPQQQAQMPSFQNYSQQFSKIGSSEAEFRQLVGDSNEGMVSRFLENKLNVLTWYRSPRDRRYIFGAQLSVARLKEGLKPIVQQLDPSLRGDIALTLLDDSTKPVAISQPGFHANWKRPFVASELGEDLPHWEMAIYLLNPGRLAASARNLKVLLGLLIYLLLLAIGIGGWLIVTYMNRQLALARQKTDFVSNVSHELKTPLTSIRMFSELLAEDRVVAPEKRQSYLNIITAEASRLTRLINNVLDFSRMERGEKKYRFEHFDMVELVRQTVESYRPQLEAANFKLCVALPDFPVRINGDRDTLAQVIVNLLSNAEKYSGDAKEIGVEIEVTREPLPHVDLRVLDRGPGVPRGSEEKIFEQFYRAHDSLSSGIQGSGLGLTLARQIARAHGGDVLYRPRDGGGSCFILRMPLEHDSQTPPNVD